MAKRKEFPEDVKGAILAQPVKEKDKLLIRLIAKDDLLIEQLQFKLLENTQSDIDYRVNSIIKDLKEIDSRIESKTHVQLNYFLNYGIKKINRFKKVVKNDLGEARCLNLLLSLVYLDILKNDDYSTWAYKNINLIFKKVAALIKIVNKVHPDYKIEFEDDIEAYLLQIKKSANSYPFLAQQQGFI
jgi:hypothetical protein